MSGVSFLQLKHELEQSGCGADAAQAHATLSGLICAGPRLPADWMQQVAGGGDNADCRDILELLRQQVTVELDGGDMSFDLLLPDDDEPLGTRADALAQWCQGFLVGLTTGGIRTGEPLPGEVAEIVSDFSTLSQAMHDGEAEEEDEQAWVELREFVRVGVQLVFEELNAGRKSA